MGKVDLIQKFYFVFLIRKRNIHPVPRNVSKESGIMLIAIPLFSRNVVY